MPRDVSTYTQQAGCIPGVVLCYSWVSFTILMLIRIISAYNALSAIYHNKFHPKVSLALNILVRFHLLLDSLWLLF